MKRKKVVIEANVMKFICKLDSNYRKKYLAESALQFDDWSASFAVVDFDFIQC